MTPEEAGAALVELVRERQLDARSCLVAGMVLAFGFPEYAQALCDAAEVPGDDSRRVLLDFLREWIAEHPIEVLA